MPYSASGISEYLQLAQTAPFQRVTDFLSSPAVLIAEIAAAAFVAVIWLSLAYRTYKDASRRGSAALAWGIIAVLFPFAGSLIYAIVKPADFESDRQSRELEARLLKRALSSGKGASGRASNSGVTGPSSSEGHLKCPACSQHLLADYLYCPSCGSRAQRSCNECGSGINAAHSYCPYCAALQPSDEQSRIPYREGRKLQESAASNSRLGSYNSRNASEGEGRESGGENEDRSPAASSG